MHLNLQKEIMNSNFPYEVLICFKNKLTTESLNNKHP